MLSKSLEREQAESRWPFEELKFLTELGGFRFWWVVRDDGVIHLADDSAVMGTRAADYLPQAWPPSDDPKILLDRRQNLVLYRTPLRLGRQTWSFWLGFSLSEIAGVRKSIFFHDMLLALLTLGILGIILFLIIQRFLRPVKDLALGAAVIGGGELSYQIPKRSEDELGQLVEDFNRMTRDLREKTQALREGERFLTNIFASIEDGISVLDLDYTIARVNPAMERAYAPSMPLVGKKCYQAYHGRTQPCEVCPTRRTLETRQTAREMVIERTLGGQVFRYIDLYTFPLKDPASGQMTGVVEYVRDITEQRRALEDLREIDEKYGLLVSQIPAVVFRGYADWSVDFFDDKIEAMTGYTKEEFNSRQVKWRDLIPAEDLPYVERVFIEALKTDKSYVREYRLRKKNGEFIWIQSRGQIFCDAQGQMEYTSGVFFDITARKRAEEALHKYEFIANTAKDCMTLIDRNYVYEAANPAYCQAHGKAWEEVVGTSVANIWGADTFEKVIKGYLDQCFTGQAVEYEDWFVFGTRGMGCYHVSYNPYFNEDGTVAYAAVVSHDMTARKLAEKFLQESESRYRQLFENMSSGVAIYESKDGQGFFFKDLNRAGELIEKIKREELIGKNVEEVFPGVKDMGLLEVFRRVWRTGTPERVPGRLYRDDRIVGWRENYIYKLPSGDVVAVYDDITARKQAEEDKRRIQEQLSQAQKMEAIGCLAGGVAHDFNNILMVIVSYGELLRMKLKGQAPLLLYVEEIQTAAERAGSLTQQLLAFSRKQIIQPRIVDLNILVTNLKKMLGRLIAEDIDLVTVPGPKLWPVMVDPGQFEQVIVNLVVNARDAMPRGGRLIIETGNVELEESVFQTDSEVPPGSYVMVAVSDNGVGLDQETQARIFDPFFTTKELGNGTGLGLSVVYGIVKQSGGHITVHSEPGHGATFKIYLPPVRQAEARIDLSPAPPTLPEGAETILLVEDDESVRRVTRMMLEKQGYTVLEAENGHEALRLGDQYPDPINLLFTDIMMPGLSCQEMLAGLTTQHPEIKVLFMSGHTDNVIVNQGVLDSGVAFIQKPFRLEQLAFKVREVLDAPAEG